MRGGTGHAVGMADSTMFVDARGRRRSPVTLPGYHAGRPPRNMGRRYPADPPTVEEIVSVMRCAGDDPYGLRTQVLIVLLWRAGLRISEALALAESDLDCERGGVLVRRGMGDKRREVGMDAGLEAPQSMARDARGHADRRVVVRDQRSDPGQHPPCATRCDAWQATPACARASHPTNSDTPRR